MPREDGSAPPEAWDSYADAAGVLRVALRFLGRHPQLANASVAVVGESGGGLRASYISKILLDYRTLVGGGPFEDAALYDEITAFFRARRSDIAPTDWTAADITDVFSRNVFIDPFLSHHQWEYLKTLNAMLPDGCVPVDPDPLTCDVTDPQGTAILEEVVRRGTDPVLLSQVLRCDITSVEWLHAEARKGAYARSERIGDALDLSKLVATFGALEPQDLYFVFDPKVLHETWDIGPSGLAPLSWTGAM